MSLLKSQQYGGAGGYGGVNSLSTEQRQGKFHPHTSIFVYKLHPISKIKCLTCKEEWFENEPIPAKCKKDQWQSAEEILK
jgi:hypothetical protein